MLDVIYSVSSTSASISSCLPLPRSNARRASYSRLCPRLQTHSRQTFQSFLSSARPVHNPAPSHWDRGPPTSKSIDYDNFDNVNATGGEVTPRRDGGKDDKGGRSEMNRKDLSALIGEAMHEVGKIDDQVPRSIPPEQHIHLFGKFTTDIVGCNPRHKAERVRSLGWKRKHTDMRQTFVEEALPISLKENRFKTSGLALA